MAAVAIAFLLADSSASASVQRFISFDEKVDDAAAIFLGRCSRNHSQWDPSHRWILTYSTFEVESTFKGVPPAEVTLVLPDGDVGGVHQRTSGMPVFAEGREYVIFVKNTTAGPTALFFSQGVYDVTADDRGDRTITPPPNDVVLFDPQRGAAVESEPPRSLSDFERAIRDSLERTRANKMVLSVEHQAPRRQNTLSAFLMRNVVLLVFALVGAVIIVWQLLRRE